MEIIRRYVALRREGDGERGVYVILRGEKRWGVDIGSII